MNKPTQLVDIIDNYFGAIAAWSIRSRWKVTLTSLILVLGALFFANTARIDNSLHSFFYKQDPAYIAYRDYLEEFVSDEVMYIMYSAEDKEHGPFNLDVMRTIASLTVAFEAEVPFIREATSLANVEFMRPIGKDDIEIDELLINFPDTQAELLKTRELVSSKPMYANYLISEDGQYATIILQMTRTSTDTLEDIIYDPELGTTQENLYPVVSARAVSEILTRPEFSAQGINFYISGDVSMNTTYIDVMVGDMVNITLIALLLIVIVCSIMFRVTLVGITGPIVVVLLSVMLTIGLLGFLDWPISNFFSLLPTLLCAVGIAQSVHILLEYQRGLAATGDRNLSVQLALQKVGGACLMAALTTAAGFAVMGVSQLKMLAQFGIYSAFGIVVTFLFSATLLVVFLSGKTRPNDIKKKGQSAINPLILPMVEKAILLDLRHPKLILLISALIFVASFFGILQLRNDFNFVKEFKPQVEWRQHTEKIEQEMGGTLRMSYLIDTGVENGVKDPALIQRLAEIQEFAAQQPLVKKSLSLADMIKDINQTFHGNDTRYHRVPEQKDLLAQYFLVYEFSGGEEMEEFVSHDFSKTVIEFQVEMTYASNLEALIEKLDTHVQENPLPNAQGRKTGIGLLYVKLAKYIGDTQITSYSLVFTIIALFMCISFGSIKVGLLSMIPNLTPVILALGALGWLGVPLDYMKLLLATVAIGIAVDDTIHLVSALRRRFFETGNYQQAVQMGLRDVGPALVVTSVILIVSFSAFVLSSTFVLSSFGYLLGGTIAAALLADLFLMPALIVSTKPFGPEFTPEQ